MKILELSLCLFMLAIWAASFEIEDELSDNSLDYDIVPPLNVAPKLMQKILSSESQKNVVYSPFAVNIIIALLIEASEPWSTTYQELIQLLPDNFSYQFKDDLRSVLDNIKSDLRQEINVETKLYSRNTDLVHPEYVRTIKTFYNTDMVDLNSLSAKDINKWVEEVTKGQLKEIVVDDDLWEANMILINVLYFKGGWHQKFLKNDTFIGKFYLTGQDEVEVSYMKQTNYFMYYENMDVQVLKLPYEGDKYNMILILPRSGELDELIANINEEKLAAWQSQMNLKSVHITLPKFKFSSEIDLEEILKSLGLYSIFNADANLTKLGDPTSISRVSQKVGIAIDEHGTTAFAATLVISSRSGTDFIADHPFLFLIQEDRNKEIIFAGKIVNPNLKD